MKAELDLTAWGPRDYVQMPFIHPDWKVLDIGPGGYPLKRANVYVDNNIDTLKAIDLEKWQTATLGDIHGGLPQFEDDEFDYVWCSHVFEHLLDPLKAATTLSRIAKRGTIVMPSFAKESLFLFEEVAHLWLVLPNPTEGKPPIFVERNNAFLQKLRDPMVQKATCFLYRTGTHHDCTTERYMRSWYQENESALDVVYHWREELNVQVIR